MTYEANKNAYIAKCNSGRIGMQWFHIKHYIDYQYTKLQSYTSRVKKIELLHDKRLGFPTNIGMLSIDILLTMAAHDVLIKQGIIPADIMK